MSAECRLGVVFWDGTEQVMYKKDDTKEIIKKVDGNVDIKRVYCYG